MDRFTKHKGLVAVITTAALIIQLPAAVWADDYVPGIAYPFFESELMTDEGSPDGGAESHDGAGQEISGSENADPDNSDGDTGADKADPNNADTSGSGAENADASGSGTGNAEAMDDIGGADDAAESDAAAENADQTAVSFVESEEAAAAWILPVSPDQDLNGLNYVLPVNRIWGQNRYETSRRVVEAYMEGTPLEGIIVADGNGFADSLSAGSLSAVTGFPILLVNKASMPDQVGFIKNHLESGKRVYVLGGGNAVDASIEQKLNDYDVKRIEGKDRYATNLKALQELEAYDENYSQLIVCYGKNYPDAISCSATGLPIMLSNGSSMTKKQADYLTQHAFEQITIVGGTAVISDGLQQQLADYGSSVERICGNERYATSAAVAEYFFDKAAVNEVFLADGGSFPDALSGGALACKKQAPIIVSKRWHEESAASYLEGHDGLSSLTVLGGANAVPEDVIISAAPQVLSQNSMGISENTEDRYFVTSNYNYDNKYNTLGKYGSYARALEVVNHEPKDIRYEWYIYDSVNQKVVKNWSSSVYRTEQWARAIAADARHGYGCIGEQTPDNYKLKYARWGMYGDYSCSTYIAMAYELSGICNMRDIARDNNVQCNYGIGVNFSSLPAILTIANSSFTNISGTPKSGLRAGDILLSNSHVAMSLGGGWILEATMNELNSEFAVPTPGDQTGNEIKFSPDPGGWVYIFRPKVQ